MPANGLCFKPLRWQRVVVWRGEVELEPCAGVCFAKTETEWACSRFGWVVLAKASRKNARFSRFSRTIKNEDLFDSSCGFSVKVCKSTVCGISVGVRKQILTYEKNCRFCRFGCPRHVSS